MAKRRSGLFAEQSKMTKKWLSALDKTFQKSVKKLSLKKKTLFLNFILSTFESALKKIAFLQERNKKQQSR